MKKYILPLVLLLLSSVAWAHPFGSQYESYQITLTPTLKGVEVHLQTEIPSNQVMREFYIFLEGRQPDPKEDKAFTRQRLQTLEQNLAVQVDGENMPVKHITPGSLKNGVGNANFFTYHLKLGVDMDWKAGESHEIRVINGNAPGQGAYFRHRVAVAKGFEVVKSSFDSAKVDPSVEGADGWTQDRSYRDYAATVKLAEATVKPTKPGDEPEWYRIFMGVIWGLGAIGFMIRWRKARRNRVR